MAAAVILSMTGCQDAAVNPFEQPPPVQVNVGKFPLAVGNYWTYLINYPDKTYIDTLKISIISKYLIEKADTNVDCFNYLEKYSSEDPRYSGHLLGKIFSYKNAVFMTQNNRYVYDPPQYSRVLIDSMFAGAAWEDTLFQNLAGINSIIERRIIETKLDTMLYSIKYRSCFKIGRYWLYSNSDRKDTIKTGTDIYCPGIGIIYQNFGTEGAVYEERILKDYMFSIKN